MQGRDTSLYFTSQGVTFVLTDTKSGVTKSSVQSVALRKDPPAAHSQYVLKLDFVGANPQVHPRGQETTGAVVSYFTGPQDHSRTGVPTYGKIVYFTGRTEGVNSGFPSIVGPILTPDLGYTTFVTKVATYPLVGIGWYRSSTGVWYLDVTRNGCWEKP